MAISGAKWRSGEQVIHRPKHHYPGRQAILLICIAELPLHQWWNMYYVLQRQLRVSLNQHPSFIKVAGYKCRYCHFTNAMVRGVAPVKHLAVFVRVIVRYGDVNVSGIHTTCCWSIDCAALCRLAGSGRQIVHRKRSRIGFPQDTDSSRSHVRVVGVAIPLVSANACHRSTP